MSLYARQAGDGPSELTRLQHENKQLLALLSARDKLLAKVATALEPFAKMADALDEWVTADPRPETPNYAANSDDLHTARSTLKAIKSKRDTAP